MRRKTAFQVLWYILFPITFNIRVIRKQFFSKFEDKSCGKLWKGINYRYKCNYAQYHIFSFFLSKYSIWTLWINSFECTQVDVYFSLHEEILYINTNSNRNQSRNKNKEIYIFTSRYIHVEKSCFFLNVELKFRINNF